MGGVLSNTNEDVITDPTLCFKEFYFTDIEDKVTHSSLAYNRRETRDKRPLGRDLDRSWCHRRTMIKLFSRSP